MWFKQQPPPPPQQRKIKRIIYKGPGAPCSATSQDPRSLQQSADHRLSRSTSSRQPLRSSTNEFPATSHVANANSLNRRSFHESSFRNFGPIDQLACAAARSSDVLTLNSEKPLETTERTSQEGHMHVSGYVDRCGSTRRQPSSSGKQQYRMERVAKECEDLQRQSERLQQHLNEKEIVYSQVAATFHRRTMSIRATDDDYSTIRTKLTTLQSKISALPLLLKKHADERTSITRVFIERWPHLSAAIDQLCRRSDDGALDYPVICHFVEKLATEEVINQIYDTPVHVGFPGNDAFAQISQYMESQDQEAWAIRLRQQLCKIAAASKHNDMTPMRQAMREATADITRRLVEQLSLIYIDPVGHPTLVAKVTKIVESAAKLSLAMHGQETRIYPMPLVEGIDILDDDHVAAVQHGSMDNARRIAVLVCSPFAVLENQQPLIIMRGKAICF